MREPERISGQPEKIIYIALRITQVWFGFFCFFFLMDSWELTMIEKGLSLKSYSQYHKCGSYALDLSCFIWPFAPSPQKFALFVGIDLS